MNKYMYIFTCECIVASRYHVLFRSYSWSTIVSRFVVGSIRIFTATVNTIRFTFSWSHLWFHLCLIVLVRYLTISEVCFSNNTLLWEIQCRKYMILWTNQLGIPHRGFQGCNHQTWGWFMIGFASIISGYLFHIHSPIILRSSHSIHESV